MNVASLLTSSALAGRAARGCGRATCDRGGLRSITVVDGTIRCPFVASSALHSSIHSHVRCRASMNKAHVATRATLVARASVESREEDDDEASTSSPPLPLPPSAFTVTSYFDPTAGLTTAQLAALASAALEADAAGGSRRQIKVAALARQTGLDRSEVLQWLRSVEELMPGPGGGGGGGDAAAKALRESTLGAYAAAGAAAAARAKAASTAKQEERQRRREAADAKRSGGKKGEGTAKGEQELGEDDDGTWSTKKALGRRGGSRLSKAAAATLDRVYAQSPFPSDEVVSGVRELHRELPKRLVLDYFAERRREDGKGKKAASAARAGGGAPAAARE